MISNETALIERARKEFHRHIARMATARDPNADMAAWAYAWGDMLLGNLARIARTPADGPEPVAYAVYKKGKHGVWDLGLSVDQQYLSSGEFTVAPLYTPVPGGPAPAVSEAEVEAAVRAYLEHPADDVPGIGPVVNLHAAMRAALEAAQRARK